jgi:hypothetical protein
VLQWGARVFLYVCLCAHIHVVCVCVSSFTSGRKTLIYSCTGVTEKSHGCWQWQCLRCPLFVLLFYILPSASVLCHLAQNTCRSNHYQCPFEQNAFSRRIISYKNALWTLSKLGIWSINAAPPPIRQGDENFNPPIVRSRDGAVGIATGYGLDDQGVGVRVPVGSRIFSSPRRPERIWGPPNLLFNGYRGLFLRG